MEYQTIAPKSVLLWRWTRLAYKQSVPALNSKNPWQQLKMLGSQPKVNMLLMKPDELEAQIRHRATQFRVQASDKKSKGRKTTPAEVDIDPAQLTMLTDTFAYAHDADLEVRQLPMAESRIPQGRPGIWPNC